MDRRAIEPCSAGDFHARRLKHMRHPAYAFAETVDRQIELLPRAEYFRRIGRAKVLLEELLPLSRLGLHFASPGLSVEVEAYEDDGPVDGRIIATGYKDFAYDVEVTFSRTYEDALRSELAMTQQITPGAGPISRDRQTREVVAEYGSLNHDEHIASVASALYDLYAKKATKHYPIGTILVVAFDEVSIYGFADWTKLAKGMATRGQVGPGLFRGVYFFNCATNELHTPA